MRQFLFFFKKIMLFVFIGSVAQAQNSMNLQKTVVNQQKAYPGGRDEDDLKVQDELKSILQKVDRRSIELRVLKTHFKKTDAELIIPSETEEEH